VFTFIKDIFSRPKPQYGRVESPRQANKRNKEADRGRSAKAEPIVTAKAKVTRADGTIEEIDLGTATLETN